MRLLALIPSNSLACGFVNKVGERSAAHLLWNFIMWTSSLGLLEEYVIFGSVGIVTMKTWISVSVLLPVKNLITEYHWVSGDTVYNWVAGCITGYQLGF